MEKAQKNIQRNKKKNTQTGILVGQNTNLFSQLSANFLQTKNQLTQQQDQFLKSTQIIQYHDQNINRIIGLLKKKADVTKGKAAVQLKQQVIKMGPEQIQQFIPIFAQLFLQTIINEQSKQVIDQFSSMLVHLLTQHKKITLKQIKTLYGPMLINSKLNPQFKAMSLLFNGTQKQQQEKAITLLLKSDINKKFLIMSKIILQNEEIHKIGQPQFQRNCAALLKIIKDFIRIRLSKAQQQKKDEKQWFEFIQNIDQLLTGKCIDQYINNGGKAKASILQIYSKFIDLYALNQNYKVDWKQYSFVIGQNYLDKDMIVQQSLWKNCNKNFILSLKKIAIRQQMKDQYALLNKNLPKIQDKLFQILKIGGLQMYKSLKSYLQVFPQCILNQNDEHKQTVNKITFIRKLFSTLLDSQDQNEARLDCYFELGSYFIPLLSKLIISEQQANQNKKAKQINTLSSKALKQILENLQDKYYKIPSISKNSPTYYIPNHFCKLIQNHLLQNNIKFQFKFNPQHTFTLYSSLNKQNQASQKLFEQIFEKCVGNQDLQLKYLLNFPKRNIKVDLTESNKSIEKSSKIFLLSQQASNQQWFIQNWDEKKSIIIYDPRITEKQLNDFVPIQGQQIDLNYSISKNLPSKLFDDPSFDKVRFNFFLKCLNDPDYVHSIKFLIPFVIDFLMARNPSEIINSLLALFKQSTILLKQNTWVVSLHEVTKIRIISKIFFDSTKKQNLRQIQKLSKDLLLNFFENYCEFCRRIYNYRMQKQVQNMLQTATNVLMIEQMKDDLFKSVFNCLVNGVKDMKKVKSKQEKTKKTRLTKFVEFLQKTLWYLIPMNNVKDYIILIEQVMKEENWKEASVRPDIWIIGQTVLNRMNVKAFQTLASNFIGQYQKYAHSLGLITCSQIILPLQMHPSAKSMYIKLQQFISKQIIQKNPEVQLQIIKVLINTSLNQVNDAYTTSFGIKNIIKQIMKQYTNFNEETMNQFLKICLQTPINLIRQSKGQVLKCGQIYSVIENLMSQLPLNDIIRANQIYLSIKQSSLTNQNQKYLFLSQCGILSIFWDSAIGVQFFSQENRQNISLFVKKLFSTVLECLKSTNQEENNFAKTIFFTVLTTSLTYSGIDIYKQFQKQILNIFQQKIRLDSTLHGIAQGKRMKFASRFFNQFGDQFISYIVKQIPNECLKQYQVYKEIIQQMEAQQENQNQNNESLKQQHILNMFIQFSEVFMRTGMTVLKSDCCPDEITLLKLLDCPFAGLKKTIFILLKQMYEQKVVSRQPPSSFKDMLSQKFNLNNIQQISPLLAADLSSYFYTWKLILLRRQAIEKPLISQEQFVLSLEDYLNQQNLYQPYLKTSFQLLQTHLEYMKNESQYNIQNDQLLSDDLVSIAVDDSNYGMHQKLFKLIIKSLFSFVLNFPLFLRDFIDRNKKYRNICERLLRNIISDGIFNEEVKRVEIKQAQWKAQGNFQIYVNNKNRQIYAEYTHDVIRIGLRLIMKTTYPLMPLTIQFGDGLKIEEGGRWQLMLQTQLHSRNNTIINGILLWKDNIDKKLSGVQQCAICYDIVNASGQLPKKACKTCKKKFHGNCIMKWFSKSNKSQCPLCKSQFL